MRALAAAALLLLMCTAQAKYCEDLRDQYRAENRREITVKANGKTRGVALYGGAAPSHAAAALLHAVLTYGMNYSRVRVEQGPHRVSDFANKFEFVNAETYTDLVVGVSLAWAGEAGKECKYPWMECGVAGERLREFGIGAAPVRMRVHLCLNTTNGFCRTVTEWSFFKNATSLSDCNFLNSKESATMYYVDDENSDIAEDLIARVKAYTTLVSIKRVNRKTLVQEIQTRKQSFLFLDYEIWNNHKYVVTVVPPPCTNVNNTCLNDWPQALRVADGKRLITFSFPLFHKVHEFNPQVEALRKILEDTAVEDIDIKEAACKWALNNSKTFEKMVGPKPNRTYTVLVLLCNKDPDRKQYELLLNNIINKHINNKNLGGNRKIKLLPRPDFDCNSDPCVMSGEIDKLLGQYGGSNLIGVVAGGIEAIALRSELRMPLVLYDVPAYNVNRRSRTVWASMGDCHQLAHALRHFASVQGWSRLSIISEQDTSLADLLFDALKADHKLKLRNFPVFLNISREETNHVLEDLRNSDARIVFVNTRADVAATILSVAISLNMTAEDKFVWIVREWQPNNVFSSINVIQISYWCMGDDNLMISEGIPDLREKMREMWPKRPWPPRAVSLADAVLTVVNSFEKLINRMPTIEDDLHTKDVIREYYAEINSNAGLDRGVLQELRYSKETLSRAQPYLFVDRWRGTQRESVGQCVGVRCNLRELYSDGAPHDGTSRCVARAGDAYLPSCYDAVWITLLIMLLVTPPIAWFLRRAVRQRLARRDRELMLALLARRERAAEALAVHLVPRAALELREELGAGRFGRVSLALLRTPDRAPRVVAAKALQQGAGASEESEFLREACTLAALDHEHIVRLVGVCADDGPPLVLMEHAFFGDLLRYLRARRHLAEAGAEAEGTEGAEEATHVGPAALTRLAREAAAALGYLALRGLVHRDVRAANCLVDGRRSLKLADFGMARETAAGADGSAEYACRRRALFPVLWMAPESLANGVFSAASDVWALGVLLLELVTLGARPYGDTSPLHVLQYVAAGGRPPLPLDLTAQTRGVALACWRREPEQRPSAADVVSYLAERPRALQPALRPARPDLTDADSGYGEPSSPDLLAPYIGLDILKT